MTSEWAQDLLDRAAEEPIIEALTKVCATPACDTPVEAVAGLQAAIDARVNNARLVAGANWPPEAASASYPNENACLAGVRAAIKARGFANCPP